MSYSTLSSTWPTPEIKPTQAKLRTYTGEEIVVKGAVDVKVRYGGQEAEVSLIIVDGQGQTLLGRDWLRHLRLDWATLNHVTQKTSELATLVHAHSALFSEGLGLIKGTTAQLYPKQTSLLSGSSSTVRDERAKEIDRQVALGILEPVKFSHAGRTDPQERWLHSIVRRLQDHGEQGDSHGDLSLTSSRGLAGVPGRWNSFL